MVMEKKVTLDAELFFDALGTLQSYLLLIEKGIQQPDKKSEIAQVKKLLSNLTEAGNLE
jgi:hypothetical protein